MTPDASIVLDLLTESPSGVTREGLALLTGMRDSRARIAVEELRANGHLVVTTPQSEGERRYVLARSYEEYAEWRSREPFPRAMRMLAQIRAMDRTATRRWPEQLRLEVA